MQRYCFFCKYARKSAFFRNYADLKVIRVLARMMRLARFLHVYDMKFLWSAILAVLAIYLSLRLAKYPENNKRITRESPDNHP